MHLEIKGPKRIENATETTAFFSAGRIRAHHINGSDQLICQQKPTQHEISVAHSPTNPLHAFWPSVSRTVAMQAADPTSK